MHLFIDTNIYLSFFHLSSDDLTELKKLIVLVKKGEVTLYLPQQIEEEFYRNREVKISDALKKFSDNKLNNQFPQMCKQYTEYDEVRAAIKSFNKSKSELLEKLTDSINKGTLLADRVIGELFMLATTIETNDEIFNLAERRVKLGNPPGKNRSYGDAICWESLLSTVPDEEALVLVSDDGDYTSDFNSNELSPFLKREWEKAKDSDIRIFKRLSEFASENFPELEFGIEIEKELLILKLSESPTYASTRRIVNKLVGLNEFTSMQQNDILDAALSNSQVYQIITDSDIRRNLKSILSGDEQNLDKDKLKKFYKWIGEELPATEWEDKAPF